MKERRHVKIDEAADRSKTPRTRRPRRRKISLSVWATRRGGRRSGAGELDTSPRSGRQWSGTRTHAYWSLSRCELASFACLAATMSSSPPGRVSRVSQRLAASHEFAATTTPSLLATIVPAKFPVAWRLPMPNPLPPVVPRRRDRTPVPRLRGDALRYRARGCRIASPMASIETTIFPPVGVFHRVQRMFTRESHDKTVLVS